MSTTFPVDLNPSFYTFLDTLATAQNHNETLGRMQDMVSIVQTRLDEKWATLKDLAYQGLEQDACKLLDVFLREWSGMEALALIVDSEEWIDPKDQSVQNDFWEKLAGQHIWLESRLLRPFNEGKKTRDEQETQNSLDLVETRIKYTEQSVEKLVQQNADLSKTVTFLLQHIEHQQTTARTFVLNAHHDTRKVINDAHSDARTSLTVAIEAVKETKQTVSQFIQPALDIMQYTSEHVNQEIGASVEQAVERVERKRPMRRTWLLIGFGVVALVALSSVFIGMHFLY